MKDDPRKYSVFAQYPAAKIVRPKKYDPDRADRRFKIAAGSVGAGVVLGLLALLVVFRAPAYHGPRGGTARCGDGTISFSSHSSGTCSYHGGVAVWNTSFFWRLVHDHAPLPDDPDYNDDNPV